MNSKKGRDITDLPKLVKNLSKKDYKLFERFYSMDVSIGKLENPKEMDNFIKSRFGSLSRVKSQKIIAIYNNFTGEGSLFNELRGIRPKPKMEFIDNLDDKTDCPFCDAEKRTPCDVFGRVKGKYCITASNVAKYDQFHGVIIFNEHNPLRIEKEWLKDYLETAEKWFEKVKKTDKKATNLFLMWNCLWRAAASVVHGHMQIMGSRMQYGRIQKFEEIVEEYNCEYDSNYFEDLVKIHKSLRLVKETKKGKFLFYLTPVKDREIVILSKEKKFSTLYEMIYAIIQNYLSYDLKSFNMALFKVGDYWIVRLVNRGNLKNKNSDIGGMELYADPVIASDPFEMADNFKT